MLDQSFSAHNFDIIYGIESRKGNIEISNMPKEYQKIVSELKETRKAINELKKKDDKKSIEDLPIKKKQEAKLQQDKEKILLQYLDSVACEVCNSKFRFTLQSFILKDKEIFQIDTTNHFQFFAIKQLQHNLKSVFKVKQSNRHQILSNIKTFLNSKIPVYVIRTDISGFFESIPQRKLMKMVMEDSLLNHKSKAFIQGILMEYETIKDKKLVPCNYGIPRGVGISSYLSELYMRDLDKKISSRQEVMFYARYVDDIFIILTSLPKKESLQSYYNGIVKLFNGYELELKQPKEEGKCMLIDMFRNPNKSPTQFDYLGYTLSLSRTYGMCNCKFKMKGEKIDAIKKKIDNAITHFNHLSKKNVRQAYHDLMDSLDYITGNIALTKTKSGVKAGLYYSNDLLDNFNELDELTNYLLGKNISPYKKLNGWEQLQQRIKDKITNIDFKKRWIERKFNRFSIERINEIEDWLL